MVLVALETSTRQGSVAVDSGDGPRHRTIRERAHAVDLLPSLEALLADVDRRARDLTAVAVGIGPGSYTGLRVGIATALGLARATDAKVVGIPSLEALAWQHAERDVEVDVLFNAYARSVYHARYLRTNAGIEVRVEPCAIDPQRAAAQLSPERPILGDATIPNVVDFDESQRARLRTDCFPRADAILELARIRLERGESDTLSGLRPLYLKPFEAKQRRR